MTADTTGEKRAAADPAAARFLDSGISRIGKLAGWLVIVLCVVTVFDVVTRRFLVLGSIVLQELEWYLHTALFMLTIGYGYLVNAHVRVDVVREHLTPRGQAILEIVGCLLFLLPFCFVLVWFSWDLFARSWIAGENSPHAAGIPHRWVIKAVLPVGFVLLALAGLTILLRNLAFLARGRR